jgi:hypothetical protein
MHFDADRVDDSVSPPPLSPLSLQLARRLGRASSPLLLLRRSWVRDAASRVPAHFTSLWQRTAAFHVDAAQNSAGAATGKAGDADKEEADFISAQSGELATFKLSTKFVERFRSRSPPFGFNGLGELVYQRTYARLTPAGSKEQWYQTVERVVNGTYNMQKRWIEHHQLGWNPWRAQKSAQVRARLG